jgi:hypothetical protein
MPLIIDLDQSRDREVKYNLVCLGRRARLRPVLPLLVNSAVGLPLYIDQARSRMEQALSDARRLAHPQTLAALLFFANRVDWITRSPQVHIEEVLALSTQHDFRHYWGWAPAFRGRSLIAFGHASEGLASLMEGLAELDASGSLVNRLMLVTWVAEAHSTLGQPVEEMHCLC